MNIVKSFSTFINESNANIELMKKNIEVAYEKEGTDDVRYGNEDDKFYNFYVLDVDMDNANIAATTLEDPSIFGERVLFEFVDLTVKMYAELKKIGVDIPEHAEHVIHVMIAKKHPGYYKN